MSNDARWQRMEDVMKRSRLSVEAQEARMPLPVDVLADALQDTVHVDLGKSRAAKSVKVGRVYAMKQAQIARK